MEVKRQAEQGPQVEKQIPREVKLGEPFRPFQEMDFQDLYQWRIERKYQLASTDVVIYVSYCRDNILRTELEQRGEGDLSFWTPFGPIAITLERLDTGETRVTDPIFLSVGAETPKEALPESLRPVIEYPSVKVRFIGIDTDLAPWEAMYSFRPEGSDATGLIYLPDDPKALADLRVTFVTIGETDLSNLKKGLGEWQY